MAKNLPQNHFIFIDHTQKDIIYSKELDGR